MEKKTVEVEVKFNIGDHAWIRTGRVFQGKATCPTCGGTHQLMGLDGNMVNCPKCRDGKITVDLENMFESMEVIIDGIYIDTMQIGNGYDSCGKPFTKKGHIFYDFRSAQKVKSKGNDYYYDFKSYKAEEGIFLTKEEAETDTKLVKKGK